MSYTDIYISKLNGKKVAKLTESEKFVMVCDLNSMLHFGIKPRTFNREYAPESRPDLLPKHIQKMHGLLQALLEPTQE